MSAKPAFKRLQSLEDKEFKRTQRSASESTEVNAPAEKLWGSTRRKLILVSLCFVYFSSCASFSILSPFFPNEAAIKGADSASIGIIFGVYSLVTFLMSPLMGIWLPKVGPRFMITSGLFLMGGAETLFGFVADMPNGSVFIVFCILLRIVSALGGSMADVAIFAIVAGEFPNSIGAVTGSMEVFSGLGFMAGPPLGGVLFTAGGFRLPFIVMGASILLSLPLVMFVLPMPRETTSRESKGSLLKVMKIPGIIMLGSCIILSGVVLGFLDPTLAPHLKPFKLNPTQIGLMFLLMGAVYAISSPIVGWIGDKTKKTKLLIVLGVAFADLGYLALGPTPLVPFLPQKSVWFAAIALILLGLSCSFYLVPCLPDMMETAIKYHGLPDDITTHGVLSGIFGSLISVGAFLGPTIGGAMNRWLGFPWSATILAAILTFQGLLLAVFSIFEAAHRRKRFASYHQVASGTENGFPPSAPTTSNYGTMNTPNNVKV
ncbi:MFS-type transporter SLC18B1 isoform X2 [Nematostella vectensis]|uniref:MFS-type transporter SLC18B1 isoform X2 n=1 Tax=Nematostella vectensis TaxID=45351 RepID=UPI0020773900|nr:MFS-type transporter SLC18B1 isoform X2 [Nematostella vectensis]